MRLVLILAAVLTFAASQAWACLVEPPTEAYAQEFIKQHYHEYDYIVKVRVREVYPLNNFTHPVARIEVLETYKGEMPQEVKVYDEFKNTSCSYGFKQDQERIVILKKKEDKFYLLFIAVSIKASKAGEKFLQSLEELKELTE